MRFDSTHDVGDVVEFTDDEGQRTQGTIFAVTVAEVGPDVVGYWYRTRLVSNDETEVEFEEAGSDSVLIKSS